MQTLDKLMETRRTVPLNEFFTIAVGLARALGKVHEAGIIHGGVKPHNILVDTNTLAIRLTDFISAVDVRDVSHFIYDRFFIRGTLAYTSPEQTGRISHRVAFSSDLYGLGIVFYEMFTGRLPFFSDDPLELIHSHLAEESPQVHEPNPGIPVALSKIVAILMAKEPEKRYQGCNGLLADLTRCKDEYAASAPYATSRWRAGSSAGGSPSYPRWSAATRKPGPYWMNTSKWPKAIAVPSSSPACRASARRD